MRRACLFLILGMAGILAAGCSSAPTNAPSTGGGGAADFSYTFSHTFGLSGSGSNGTFSSGPEGVAVGLGAIYVGDNNYSAVDKFDLSGNYLGQNYYGSAQDLGGMAADKFGNVYVTNYDNGTVDEFDQNLNFLHSFTGGQFGTTYNFSGPYGVKVDSSLNLYVLDYSNQVVYKVDQTDTILNTSSGTLSLYYPYDVALAPNGSLFVADSGNSRIVALNSSLVSTGSFDGSNGGTAFSGVYSVAVDSQGNVIVPDYSNSNVQKFTSAGAFLKTIGNTSSSVTWNEPYYITTDGNNNVYISDIGNDDVAVFNAH